LGLWVWGGGGGGALGGWKGGGVGGGGALIETTIQEARIISVAGVAKGGINQNRGQTSSISMSLRLKEPCRAVRGPCDKCRKCQPPSQGV